MRYYMSVVRDARLDAIELQKAHMAGVDPPRYPTHDAAMKISKAFSKTMKIAAKAALYDITFFSDDSIAEDEKDALRLVAERGALGMHGISTGAALGALTALLAVAGPHSWGATPDVKAGDGFAFFRKAVRHMLDWSAEITDGWWEVKTNQKIQKEAALQEAMASVGLAPRPKGERPQGPGSLTP